MVIILRSNVMTGTVRNFCLFADFVRSISKTSLRSCSSSVNGTTQISKDVPENPDIINTHSGKRIRVRTGVSEDLLSKEEVDRKIILYHTVLGKGSDPLNDEEIEFCNWVRIEVLRKFEQLGGIEEMQERIRAKERAEGYVYCLVKLGESLNNDEADLIVDSVICHHERPGGHPLQNARLYTPLPIFARNPANKLKL